MKILRENRSKFNKKIYYKIIYFYLITINFSLVKIKSVDFKLKQNIFIV